MYLSENDLQFFEKIQKECIFLGNNNSYFTKLFFAKIALPMPNPFDNEEPTDANKSVTYREADGKKIIQNLISENEFNYRI